MMNDSLYSVVFLLKTRTNHEVESIHPSDGTPGYGTCFSSCLNLMEEIRFDFNIYILDLTRGKFPLFWTVASVLEKPKEVFHIGLNPSCPPTWFKKYGRMDKSGSKPRAPASKFNWAHKEIQVGLDKTTIRLQQCCSLWLQLPSTQVHHY